MAAACFVGFFFGTFSLLFTGAAKGGLKIPPLGWLLAYCFDGATTALVTFRLIFGAYCCGAGITSLFLLGDTAGEIEGEGLSTVLITLGVVIREFSGIYSTTLSYHYFFILFSCASRTYILIFTLLSRLLSILGFSPFTLFLTSYLSVFKPVSFFTTPYLDIITGVILNWLELWAFSCSLSQKA